MSGILLRSKKEYDKLELSDPFILYSVTISTEAWVRIYSSGTHCDCKTLRSCAYREEHRTDSCVFIQFKNEFRNKLNDISRRGKDFYSIWSASFNEDEITVHWTVDNCHELTITTFTEMFKTYVFPILNDLPFDGGILKFNEEYIRDKNIHVGFSQLHYLNNMLVRVVDLLGEYHIDYVK